MDNYIVINGKKAELTEEQLEKLGIKVEKENPFTRKPYEERYYYITENGNINFYSEDGCNWDTQMYDNVNYFNDKDFAQQVAWHELLNRNLLKYAYEHDAADCDWNDTTRKFHISFSTQDDDFVVSWICTLKDNNVYFSDEKIAEAAIEDVVKPFMRTHPEFEW